MSTNRHKATDPKPPAHLTAETKAWWSEVVGAYRLEAHHLRILTLAGEAWDRCQEARKAIAKHGLTFQKHGQPTARPEVNIERDARVGFARLLRELALDVTPPEEVRLPRRAGTGD
jgi:phage terminase small subunit